ncbi:hypothetical protein FA13DRAFT_840867 [Coprinellus micaceus]|uniref:Uncharacterized protein n=1 Tax=Coprinellus micaceus TaxID=71717 RepID=A0A4Y7T1P4_COPMI|nr:hypothetical protein FA13DRAFT_840867 [Coprinellus micaceus]
MKIINRGMDKEKSFAYWMNRATKWREELVKAVESGNKEWIFVCAARTAAIIFEKTLKHPNVNKELTSTQIRILQNNGQTLLGDVQGLKKELKEVYAQWAAIERVRQQELDRDIFKLQSVLTAEEGEDKPLPKVPAPEPESDSVDNLHPIHIRASEISRPGSPSFNDRINQSDFAKSNLMKAPSRSNSPPEGAPPTYEEVMGDLLEIDGSVGDGGSDYNIQVVEPDAASSRSSNRSANPGH